MGRNLKLNADVLEVRVRQRVFSGHLQQLPVRDLADYLEVSRLVVKHQNPRIGKKLILHLRLQHIQGKLEIDRVVQKTETQSAASLRIE